MTVSLAGRRPSFFGDLLPPGGWSLHAKATAASLGQMPLCVLSSGTGSTDDIAHERRRPCVSATGCLVQSNGDIAVQDSATLQAGAVQAVGAASRRDHAGAPGRARRPIADPFASMRINPNGLLCNPLDLVFDLGVNVLAPGIHCGNLTVRKRADRRAAAGRALLHQEPPER